MNTDIDFPSHTLLPAANQQPAEHCLQGEIGGSDASTIGFIDFSKLRNREGTTV